MEIENECTLNKDSFIMLKPFMVTELNLSGNTLIIFAAIYGVTITKGLFYGSLEYLAKWCNCTTRNVISCLQKLTEAGLVKKRRTQKGCIYVSTYKDKKDTDVYESEESSHEESSSQSEKSSLSNVKKLHIGSEKSSHNNIANNLVDNINLNSFSPKSKTYKQEDYTRVYDAYKTNCKTLYDRGLLPVENPVLPTYTKGLIKKAFEDFGVEAVVDAVVESINHRWLVDNKYPFAFIFGKNELPMLINKTYSNPKSSSYSNTFKSELTPEQKRELFNKIDLSGMAFTEQGGWGK